MDGGLDFVLGLQVRHPLGADPIDGRDDVTLSQGAARRLAARSYLLERGLEELITPGQRSLL